MHYHTYLDVPSSELSASTYKYISQPLRCYFVSERRPEKFSTLKAQTGALLHNIKKLFHKCIISDQVSELNISDLPEVTPKYKNMCILKFNDSKCKMINRSTLGRSVRGALTQAKVEGRLICGLFPAISYLEKASDDVLLCILSQSRPGDAASHMQTVLLQAFCYENCIPVVQVDNGDKLAEYCFTLSDKVKGINDCSCVLITKDLSANEEQLSPSEKILSDFYECTLEEYPRPIIELPR